MKKLLLSVIFLFSAGSLYAVGNSNPLVVSSGAFQSVDMYLNNDNSNRQAVVIGDRSSSATATVDNVIGMTVNLATSPLTTATALNVQVTTNAVAIPIVSTSVLTDTFGGIAQPVTSTYAVVTDTWNLNVNIQRLNGASVTTDGGGSINVAVPSGNVFGIAITTVSFGPQIRLGSTIAVTNAVGTTIAISGSTSTPLTVNQGTGTFTVTPGTGTYTITPGTGALTVLASGGQFNVQLTTISVTLGQITISGSTTAVTNAVGTTLTVVPFSSGTYTVTPGTGPWTVTQGTGPFTVIIATPSVAVPIISTTNITVNITTPSVAVPIVSTSNITVNITTPSVAVPIVSTSNITVNLTTPTVAMPIVSTSAIVTRPQVFVSSIALPTAQTQGSTTAVMGSGIGQVGVFAIPWTVIKTTASVNFSTQSATEIIIIASAAAPNYNYVCDCVFSNSGNAVQTITLFQSTNGNTANDFLPITVSSSTVSVGSGFGCSDPIMRSANGGQITLKPTVTSTSTPGRCRYYQGP